MSASPPPQRRPSGRRTPIARAIAMLMLAALLMPGLAGCAIVPMPAGGDLAVHSQTHPGTRLAGDFDTALYSAADENSAIVVLIEHPVDQPTQAVTLRLFWRPRAGRTPIDPNATNVAIQYLVFTGSPDAPQVGVYSGAGFLYPRGRPGQQRLKADLMQATLRLSDASPAFHDRLGKAELRGGFTVRRDDAAVTALLRQLNVQVTNALAYPRLVQAEAGPPPF